MNGEGRQIGGRHRSRIGSPRRPAIDTAEGPEALNMHILGPGDLAVGEWEKAGLDLPDRAAVRRYRLERVRQQLRRLDYAGIVLFDPLNVRYATDSTNMQLWITHNAARYAFVPTQGPVVLFDLQGTRFLSAHSEVIDEVRPAICWFFMAAGDRNRELARRWGSEIADLVRRCGGGNRRLALDRCNAEGVAALNTHGVDVCNGEEVMELARRIKCDEEIRMMRCAIHACEQSIEAMRQNLQPGISEQRLWSYLHAENIARGGEWIETRLMASGPRCNPWFQECSSRLINAGEFVAFDTDLIGTYGICVDISRTWLCGSGSPTHAQKEIYDLALEQVQANMDLLKPGTTFSEMTFDSLVYDPNEFHHYSCLYHGVGLADEYPCIHFPWSWDETGYEGQLEPGMVLCVESFLGRRSGGPGAKLEEQVLITETGHELLSSYPVEYLVTDR